MVRIYDRLTGNARFYLFIMFDYIFYSVVLNKAANGDRIQVVIGSKLLHGPIIGQLLAKVSPVSFGSLIVAVSCI